MIGSVLSGYFADRMFLASVISEIYHVHNNDEPPKYAKKREEKRLKKLEVER